MAGLKNQIIKILEKAKAGIRILPDEACKLFQTHDVLLLGSYAEGIARRKNGKVISYIVDRNINYTNICIGGCHFCAFSRKQDDPDAYLLTYEEIEQKISELVSLGGSQVLFQGGLHPMLPLHWYTELIASMKKKFPGIVFHAFSPPEILHLARISGLTLGDVIRILREAGWESMPGGRSGDFIRRSPA